MGDRVRPVPQMRHNRRGLRRPEQIPAKLRDFADKDLLQHIELTITFMTFDQTVKSHERDLDVLPRLRQFRLADVERHFLDFN